MRRILETLVLAALLGPIAGADTFLLQGGGRVQGRLEREVTGDDGTVWLEIRSAFGQVWLPRAEVKRRLPYDRVDNTIFIEEIHVTTIVGTVEKSPDGAAWSTLAPTAGQDRTELLLAGEFLRTGVDGEVDLTIGYGVVHVEPESEVHFQQRSGATLKINRGEFSTKLDDLPRNEDFKIRTPQGVLGVKGTTFLVRLTDETRVAVEEGLVQTGWGRVGAGRALETMRGDRGRQGGLSGPDRAGFDRLRSAIPIPRFEMVLVPGGRFVMGNPRPGARPEETPAHPVEVAPFAMSRFEVTNGQYGQFLRWIEGTGDHSMCHPEEPRLKSHRPAYSPIDEAARVDHPVIGVDWYDAYAFCSWIGASLPTEAQWEYACRAGSDTVYSFGNSTQVLRDYAWFGANSDRTTHPVGTKRPNAWGLCDLYGNATEWCLDAWHDDYRGAPADGSAWTEPRTTKWVVRGGGWHVAGYHLRSTARGWMEWGHETNGGFRPVWNLD